MDPTSGHRVLVSKATGLLPQSLKREKCPSLLPLSLPSTSQKPEGSECGCLCGRPWRPLSWGRALGLSWENDKEFLRLQIDPSVEGWPCLHGNHKVGSMTLLSLSLSFLHTPNKTKQNKLVYSRTVSQCNLGIVLPKCILPLTQALSKAFSACLSDVNESLKWKPL